MMRSRLSKTLFLWLATAALVLGTVAGCGGGETATPDASNTASPQASSTQIGPPPSPAQIDPTQLTVIDEWREVQVPQYPGSERLEMIGEGQSSVKNAGRMLYATADSPEQMLAFYRAALPLLGWEERLADAEKIAPTAARPA
jgi:hypothetical protein